MQTIYFGERLEDKIRRARVRYETQLKPLLTEQETREPEAILRKIERELEHPTQTFVIKRPGQGVFASSGDTHGLVDRDNPHLGREKPQGLFANDMQHQDHFVIKGPGRLNIDSSREIQDVDHDVEGYAYLYSVQGRPNLQLERRQLIDREGNLLEELSFSNRGDEEAAFTVETGSHARDIFQARSPDNTQIATDMRYRVTELPGDAWRLEARHAIGAEPSALDDAAALPSNTIRTTYYPEGAYDRFAPVDDNTLALTVKVPPGTIDQRVSLKIVSDSELYGKALSFSQEQERVWSAFQPSLKSHATKAAMNHLDSMWQTSFRDLKRLTIPVRCGEETYFAPAAGIPNFLALFGRDSLITSLEALEFNPLLARDTLASLAYYQGKQDVAFTEEEPGKILHELRLGELTRLGLSPHRPYYGTIDATPLFVMLFHDYLQRTGDTGLRDKLWGNFEAALGWIDDHVIADPGHPQYGFLAQRDKSTQNVSDNKEVAGAKGLKNIGWKDSDASTRHLFRGGELGRLFARFREVIDEAAQSVQHPLLKTVVTLISRLLAPFHEVGKLTHAKYPLALAEVQGYVYGAWKSAENLYAAQAETLPPEDPQRGLYEAKSAMYGQKAEQLKQRFNEKFWLPEEDFIAMGLQADGAPLRSVTSNGAQAFLTGIISDENAQRMVPRLMRDDMLSGWGMRTLSSQSPAFDPFAYHNGTVWPHDNALVVKGLARYGFKKEAAELSGQLLAAGRRFKNHRLPEVYSGMQREKYDRSIPIYPETCSPQAWAAGTTPSLLASMLGLSVWQAERSVIFDRPVLPDGVGSLRLSLNLSAVRTGEPTVPEEPLELLVSRRGQEISVRRISGPADIKVQVRGESARTPSPFQQAV